MEDFWRMVWDKNSPVIVVLSDFDDLVRYVYNNWTVLYMRSMTKTSLLHWNPSPKIYVWTRFLIIQTLKESKAYCCDAKLYHHNFFSSKNFSFTQ